MLEQRGNLVIGNISGSVAFYEKLKLDLESADFIRLKGTLKSDDRPKSGVLEHNFPKTG